MFDNVLFNALFAVFYYTLYIYAGLKFFSKALHFSFWHSLPITVHFNIFSVFFQIYGRACHMLDRGMADAS